MSMRRANVSARVGARAGARGSDEGLPSRPADWFELSGGALCLDFANTVSRRPSDAPIERLDTYADLLEWSRLAGILTAAERRRRADQASRHPRIAARQLAEAHAAREILYTLFAGLAAAQASTTPARAGGKGDAPRTRDAGADAARGAFTAHLRRLLGKTTLRARGADGRSGGADARNGDGAAPMAWTFADTTSDADVADLDALLWPIWWSAAELLTAAAPDARLRQCEARDCGWLFLDRSRGHRRRWCDMRVCGNREKLRRFRASADSA